MPTPQMSMASQPTPPQQVAQAPEQQAQGQAGQYPKLTPEKLMQFKQQNISPSSIVKLYSSLNPEFKQKYEAGAAKGYNIPDAQGKPMSWDDIALNMEAYGSPVGPVTQQAPQQQGGGIMQGIGNVASTVWDYATAPIDAVAGLGVKGLGAATGVDVSQNPLVKDIGANAQQTADIAPLVGATIGSAAGPFGTGAGAFAGKAIGNLIESGLDVANGAPQRRSNLSKVAGPVIEGVLNYAGDKIVTAAATNGLPYIKKGLTKMGAILTNVSDQTLERAFNQPKMMSTAIQEISDNVKQPFLGLAQQIGNTLKSKIDDAAKAIGLAKEEILANNPGATFDVSASIDDLTKVLKEENLGLEISSIGGKKSVTLLNEMGAPSTSAAATNPSITGITQGVAKPLSDKELEVLTNYVKTINKASDYSIQDVLDLKKLYNRSYTELGTNDIGTTSNAQRILRTIRETVDGKIADAMPEDLARAYKDYSLAMGAQDDFGHFLSPDNKGKFQLSDKAESYLNTLWGNTKGQRRQDIEALSQYLGIDINGKMQLLKDAQALVELFPKTGSRTLDVLRTFVAKGAATAGATVGAVTGGVPGAVIGGGLGAAATAATSPLVIGKATMKAGEFASNRIVKSFTTMMGKMVPAEREALLMFINGISQHVDKGMSPDQSQPQP